ncbi:MAG: TlpA family protein disulfide reductase [Desulfobacterales bacterium]|nr:MAG: TlpA family protein disulfide reductase [Desulfobacterales bacterium]
MKRPVKIFFASSVFLTLFFLVAPILGIRAHGETDYMEELSIVRFDEKVKAQNFILKDLNGSEVSLEDYRGKIILINFWATWCLPCRIEMPSMEKLYTRFKNDGFTILAIDMQEDADSVKAFKEKYKLNFPILLDSDGSVGQYYGVISIPTTYLVDREGYIIAGALGARDWAAENAFMLINQLLQVSPKS